MKKYLYLIITMTISLLFLFGCNNENSLGKSNETSDWKETTYETYNNLDNVFMTAKEGTVAPNKLTLVIENNSNNNCIYGEFFLLEKKVNEIWYQVPVAISEDYGFDSIGYELNPGDRNEVKIDWEWLYGSIGSGEYRIVKDVLKAKPSGGYDTYYLAAEFIIE